MAFHQDTSGQGYSPDPSSCGQKGLGSRLLFQRVLYLSGLFLLFLFVLILHHSAIHECQHGYETLGNHTPWYTSSSKVATVHSRSPSMNVYCLPL